MLTSLLADISEKDFVPPQRMSRRLRLPLAGLARLAHVRRNTLMSRPDSAGLQKKLEPVVRILTLAKELTGDADRAIIWFRHQLIASHGGRTGAQLVEDVHAGTVLAHLEAPALARSSPKEFRESLSGNKLN